MDITHVTLSLAKSTKTSKISTFIQSNHIWLAYCTVTGTYIKLYVILNEFLIKLSSQKITECVALQWSQNQLDHRFTKKNHCWIICREFVADLMRGGEGVRWGHSHRSGWAHWSMDLPILFFTDSVASVSSLMTL